MNPVIQRGSWLRNAKLATATGDAGSSITFFDLSVLPDIPARDDDVLHVVSSTDRIDRLAFVAYGDERLWWVIATANAMTAPWTSMRPGETIRIPSPRYVRENLIRS